MGKKEKSRRGEKGGGACNKNPNWLNSGTEEEATQVTICSELSLTANTMKLFRSPNRPNLRISVKSDREVEMGS